MSNLTKKFQKKTRSNDATNLNPVLTKKLSKKMDKLHLGPRCALCGKVSNKPIVLIDKTKFCSYDCFIRVVRYKEKVKETLTEPLAKIVMNL